MLEKTFQRNVLKYIESKGGYVINYDPSVTGKGGAADLICCIKGIFVAIELKVNHKLKQRQALNLKFVNNSNGIGIVLKYSNNWKHTINKLFEYLPNNKELTREQTDINIQDFLDKIKWE